VGEAPGDERGASDGAFAAPRTRIEAAIAGIWCELLGAEQIGVDQDFFELGGDSLAAVRMLAEVDELLLAQVSFADFLDTATVAALAEAVQRARVQSDRAGPMLERGPASGTAPCAFAQERLWFVDQLAGGTGAYNEAVGARIRAPLDAFALERALQEIVRRHAALRTSFAVQDGVPVQVVAEDVVLELQRIDAAGEEELRLIAAELTAAPFDLERAPLVRAVLIRVATDDQVLQLVFHHNVCDGLSHVVVFRELGALYRAYSRGEERHLPETALQYSDFARWQRKRLVGQALEDAIAPWRERLADIPAALDLPTDHPRPAVTSYRGGGRRSRLDRSTSEQIGTFSRAEGATPFATVLAAFDVLLHRYSGQETIMVGSTTAGRDRPELENVVGLLANTIVLRNDLSGDPTFRELLGRVRRVVLDGVAHQDAPFERLVAELQLEPDLSRNPIFQVLLVFRPHASLDLQGAEPFHADLRASRTDLHLWIEDAPDGYELVWEYSTDLFEPATIERMERHFVALLRAGMRQPLARISELRMVDDRERGELLAQSRALSDDSPVACMHTLFEAQAMRRPDAPAVTFEGETLTYRELNERANRLADQLRKLGIGPESLVALFLERSFELVISVLAVLKAGGAYVPLDPEYPAARISFVLSDTNAPVVLTQERLLGRLPEHTATVLCLDREDSVAEEHSPSDPPLLTTPDNLAYVIYTSGSTGKPKGVQVEHRQIARLFTATEHWYGFNEADTWVLAHSYAFDVSVWELWGALAHGGRIVVSPFWVTRSPDAMAALVADERVTVLCATPSLFTFTQGALLRRADELVLRYVVFAGEALAPGSLRPWFESFWEGGAALVNMYGITETTVHSTYRVMRRADCERDVSPIGVPIPDLSLYLLDPAGEPVPVGVAGEIYVGGGGVTRGYLNRPELTAQRFLENPFESGRLYRSGDLARRMSDGEVAFLGRMDDQVKIRGFRIELGEIRAVLEEHAAVADCAVVPVEFAPGDLRLAAYVVPATPGANDGLREQLVDHLKDRLPEYMVPTSITFAPELPLTTNGKLDRRALPAPEWERRPEVGFVDPRTPIERRVADIWGAVLGAERVGANDNFFDLGGHSLLAARVIARVRESANADVSVRALFEYPTVEAFARHLAEAGAGVNGAGHDAGDVAPSRPRAAEYPLSFQQQQLLFFDQLSPDSAVYNSALAIRVEGELDRDVLRRALAAVFRRHEALRTVLRWDEESARQVVLDDLELPFEDLSATSLGDPAELRRVMVQRARRPFELAQQAPLRTTLFRVDEATYVILFQMHHIAFDARAVEVLYQDLGETYRALSEHRLPELGELRKHYGDFATSQHERLQGETLERELDFWRSTLAGAPTVLDLRTDHPRPPVQTFDGATLRRQLSVEEADQVREACQAQRVTPYMLLFAAFATLLYRRTGQHDILLGSPMANREDPDLENLVGFLANTVVVRARLGGNPTFAELLERVRESVLSSWEHQQVPLPMVVDALAPERHPGVNPLFQVNFRVRVGEPAVPAFPGAGCEPIAVDLGLARFELALELHLGELLETEFNWSTALFERATVVRLADDYESVLRQVLADPGTRLLSLGLSEQPEPQRTGGAPPIRRLSSARGGVSGDRDDHARQSRHRT
jgi:amino acid adenylation domain-containing protein